MRRKVRQARTRTRQRRPRYDALAAALVAAAQQGASEHRTPEELRRNDILRSWYDELAHCEREYQIEHAHVSRLWDAVVQSRVLRDLLEASPPGPCRAWLCFIALVDIFVDPRGGPGDLPPPLLHPPRLRVSGVMFVDWHAVARKGILRRTSRAGRARHGVVDRLERASARLRRRAAALQAKIKREESDLYGRFPAGTYTDSQIAAFQTERYVLFLRRDEVAALHSGANAIDEKLRDSGPVVFNPESGEPPSWHRALIGLLDFTLRTDTTLSGAARHELIAAVAEEFMPGALAGRKGAAARGGSSTAPPGERVRLIIKDIKRSAEDAQARARRSGADVFDACPTFAAGKLMDAGLIGRPSMAELLADPYHRGMRAVAVRAPVVRGEESPGSRR